MRATFKRLECRRDVLSAPDFQGNNFEVERAGRLLKLMHLQHCTGAADIGHDRQTVETWENFAQNFEPFGSKVRREGRQAGDVGARPRERSHHAGADWVRRQWEDNRYERGCLLCRKSWLGPGREYNINFEPDEFGRDLGHAFAASLRP